MAAIIRNMGSISPLRKFAAGNNDWSGGMNENLIKLAMTMGGAVATRTAVLPDTGSEGDIRIDPATGFVCMWMENVPQDLGGTLTGWFGASPRSGSIYFVQDAQEFVIFADGNVWTKLIDFAQPYTPVSRTLAFFAPTLKPNMVVFSYVSGFQLAIPAGAPGSGAGLISAPGEDISFPIFHGTTQVGSVDFDEDSTEGSVNIEDAVVVNNAVELEKKYWQSQMLTIKSPADLHGANGLNLTISAEIWDGD